MKQGAYRNQTSWNETGKNGVREIEEGEGVGENREGEGNEVTRRRSEIR